MNTYELFEKAFDEQPSYILFEAMRMAAESQFDKAQNPINKEFWRLNVRDFERLEKRANRRVK